MARIRSNGLTSAFARWNALVPRALEQRMSCTLCVAFCSRPRKQNAARPSRAVSESSTAMSGPRLSLPMMASAVRKTVASAPLRLLPFRWDPCHWALQNPAPMGASKPAREVSCLEPQLLFSRSVADWSEATSSRLTWSLYSSLPAHSFPLCFWPAWTVRCRRRRRGALWPVLTPRSPLPRRGTALAGFDSALASWRARAWLRKR